MTPRLRKGLRAGLLAALILTAAWLWSAPWRQERSLRTAPLAQLQYLAHREPDNARVFYYLGTRARQAGQLDTAYDAFAHAADLNADDEPNWLAAADLAGRLHGPQGEHDLLILFLSRHPRSAAAHAALDRLHQPSAAATLPALQNTGSLTVRAETLRGQGRWAAAQKLYAQALARDHSSAIAAQGIGLCLMKEGNPARAFPFLAYSVHRDPTLPEAQAALAVIYRDAGFPDEARKRLNLAVRSAPNRADFWHDLGLVEGVSDTYSADSEQALARAVALAPGNAAYRLDLAEQEAANSRNEAAEADYRRGAADAPRDTDALSRLGGFLLDASPTPARSREAEGLLRRALAQDPSNIYARYKLGRLALDRGDAKGAVSALTVVVTHSPDIAEAWYTLGMAQERLGNAAQATRALAEARRLQQTFQERTGVQEQIVLHPQDPALRLRMARLYAQNGENAKALYEYQAHLRLAPTDRTARAELAVLEAHLRAEGRLPSMSLYAAMAAQMTKSPS